MNLKMYTFLAFQNRLLNRFFLWENKLMHICQSMTHCPIGHGRVYRLYFTKENRINLIIFLYIYI